MLYELDKPEGGKAYLNFKDSTEIAKFILFTLPRLGWSFSQDVPHLVVTPTVRKLIDIKHRIDERKKAVARIERAFPDFDDDIPFAPIGLQHRMLLLAM